VTRAALRATAVAIAMIGATAVRVTAQELRSALTADEIAVGDVFNAVVRVVVPDGFAAIFPDSIGLGPDLELAGRPYETTLDEPGGTEVTRIYPVTAWRPGEHALPALTVRVEGPEGGRELSAQLGTISVRSVLPPDTAGVQPRPPRDVLGDERLLWPWLLAALLALACVVAAFIAWRLWRRKGEAASVPALSPRERALAALDRARSLGLIETGEFKTFYSMTSEAIRHFLASMDPAWGVDRTTSELIAGMSQTLDHSDLVRLRDALFRADLVKFARHRPAADEVVAEWQAMRDWVEHFTLPVAEPEPVHAEAA